MSTMHLRKIVLTFLFILGWILSGCTRSASTSPPDSNAAVSTDDESGSRATMDAMRATLLAQTEQPATTEPPTITPTPTIEPPTPTLTPTGPTETPPVVFNTPTSQAGQETTYIVQAGDSVYSVARAYGITPDELIARNSLQYPYYLDIGQELIIPVGGSSPPGSTPAPGTRQHVVQQGEWIYSIARKYGVSPNDIIALNNLPYPYIVYPGDVLNIP
jgi:LysM repeat protein